MTILYHLPHPSTVYAGRTIANGFRNAWLRRGDSFSYLTSSDNLHTKFVEEKPDIFITSLNTYHLKFIDHTILSKAKRQGTKVFVNTPFWNSPFDQTRITEAQSLSNNTEHQHLIRSGKYGDAYYNICEQGDERMDGFQKSTGYAPKTLLLAADDTVIFPDYDPMYSAQLSYVGTNLPEKRQIFQDVFFPLRKKYSLRIYGQDWTTTDKVLNLAQKFGQYFNIPILHSMKKPPLALEAERKIYSSSVVSINVHETYQRRFGDLNERTFKIPLAGGFEIVDDVSSLHKYFREDTEIIVAKNTSEWIEKIDYYLSHPEKRLPIIENGRKKILTHHTYTHRVETMLSWYKNL